jgi:hypothetical protein
MSVDYAVPNALQNPVINIKPPPTTTGAIVPANRPIQAPPPRVSVPTPTPQTVRDLPSGSPTQSIRNSQSYQTIDLRFDSKSGTYTTSPSTPQNKQVPPSSLGTRLAMNNPEYALGREIGQGLAWYTAGIAGRNDLNQTLLRRANVDLASRGWYEKGQEDGREVAKIIRNIKRSTEQTKKRLWENRPQFQIPEIKIDFKLPKIPQVELPKFPEFDFPDISFPKPKPPIPPPKPRTPRPNGRLIDRLKDLDPTTEQCGLVQVVLIRSFAVTGIKRTFDENGSIIRSELITELADPFNTLSLLVARYFQSSEANTNWTEYDYLMGTGSSFSGGETYYEENGSAYQVGRATLNSINTNGTGGYYDDGRFIPVDIPYYTMSRAIISLNSGTLSGALQSWDASGWEAYQLIVSFPDKNACSLPPPPAPKPPPAPPECCMCCNNRNDEKIDYARIKRIMQDTLKEQKFSIDVPVCKCEFNEEAQEWEPKIGESTLDFFATSKEQAEALAQLHFENAKQFAEMCLARNVASDEAIASLPLSWQIRNEGNRPQLVIQCAEQYKDEDGKIKYKSAMYPITIPHWKGKVTDKISLPAYRKGNWEGIYVLADNSKVTINAANRAECTKILNAIKPWIPSDMKKGAYFKGGEIDLEIKNTFVKPMYGRYFSTGQKKSKPDWRIDFT